MRKAGVLVLLAAACAQDQDVESRSAAQVGQPLGASVWIERTMPTPDGGADPNPAGRRNAAMAYDPVRGVAVLHGGRDDADVFDETWEWSSQTRAWTKVVTTGSPGKRYGHSMVPFGGKIVLFGGHDGSNTSDETWTYEVSGNTRSWKKLTFAEANRPKPRYEHALAVGTLGASAQPGIVLFGGRDPGSNATNFDDSWILTSLETGWIDATDAAQFRPPGRFRHTMIFDVAGARMVTFGGETDGGRDDETWVGTLVAAKLHWTKHSEGTPSARSRARLAWYPPYARGVLFGGDVSDVDGGDDSTFLWEPAGAGAWTEIAPTASPPPLYGHTLVYDTVSKVMLLFGGESSRTTKPSNRTFEFHIDNRPTITAPNASGAENSPVSFKVSATDAIDTTQELSLSLEKIDPTPPSSPNLEKVFPPVKKVGTVEGAFDWTPECDDHDDYTLTFSVSDGVNTASVESSLAVSDVNCPPVFTPVTPPVFQEGRTDSFVVAATDPEGTGVTLALTEIDANDPNAPEVDPTFNPATGRVTWTPGARDAGRYIFTFTATDGGGAHATQMLTVMVTEVNSQPTLMVPPPQTFAEGTPGMFTVTATDPDGDPVTIALKSVSPPPASIEPQPAFMDGTFSWTPGFKSAGIYTATFTASDMNGPPVEAAVIITVTNTNRPPVVVLSPPGAMKTVSEGRELRFGVTAVDPDPDEKPTLTAGPLPEGATFVDGVFAWTPDPTQGSASGHAYTVTFTASDPSVMVPLEVTITVFDVNQPPIVDPIGPKTVAEGGTLTFSLSATDPDGQTVSFSANNLPAGASFNVATATFTWKPGCAAADLGGAFTAHFVASDGIDDAPITVPITVTGTVVTVTPTSVSFPSTRVGSAATPIALTILNGSAQVPVGLKSVTVGGEVFSVTGGGLPRTLGPGENVVAQVGFAPTAAMSRTSTITISVEDAACPTVSVPVTGVGVAAGMSISRSGADFGSVRVGSVSQPVSFTVTNVGDAAFTVNAVTVSGNEFVLSLVSPAAGGYPVLLGTGAAATFTIAAAPAEVGQRTGSVSIATDIPGSGTVQLPLTVIGASPDLEVSDPRLDFGPVDVQGQAVVKMLTLSNLGGVTLSVGQPFVTGPGAGAYKVVGATGGLTIEPGKSKTFGVSYLPLAESAAEGAAAVQITSDAPERPSIVIPLSGRGIDRHLVPSVTTLQFPRTSPGATRELPIALANMGQAPLAFGSPALAIDGSAAFTVVGEAPASVDGGGSAMVTVRFAPTARGDAAADLVVRSDDSDQPMARIALRGTAGGGLIIAPVVLDGGVVAVGADKRLDRPLVLGNDGTAAVTVSRACVAKEGASDCDAGSAFRLDGWSDGAIVAPNGSLTVNVRFAPTEAKKYTAEAIFFIAGETVPDRVKVSATGIDDVIVHGGGLGCQTGGGSPGAAWAIALVAGLFLFRRRAGWLVVLASVRAGADPATAFDLGVFRPGLPGEAVISVEKPEVLPAGAFSFALAFDYARNPLQAQRTSVSEMEAVVSDRAASTLIAAYGFGRIDVGASLPLVFQEGSGDMTGLPAAGGASLGDLALDARVLVMRGLAVGAGVTLPTGDDAAYAGAESVGAHVFAAGGLELGRVSLSASAGFRARFSEARLSSISQANEIDLGAGAAFHLGHVDVLAEVYGALGLVDEMGPASPVEAALGARMWLSDRIAFTAGVGLGLHDGIGASDGRIFLALAYAPAARAVAMPVVPPPVEQAPVEQAPVEQAPARPLVDPDLDTDGDGIPDVSDKCPDSVEDKDGWQDDDGCDDPDDDSDGIPDVVDSCMLQPETINGVKDDDGCPDKGDPSILVSKDRIELLEPVGFAGVALRPVAKKVLAQVAATLRAHPEMKKLVIHVHVRRGSPAAVADKLSQRRGDAIVTFLAGKGIDRGRLEVRAHGNREPLGKPALDERVELNLTD